MKQKKNRPRAQTTIDVTWAHFCGLWSLLVSVVVGIGAAAVGVDEVVEVGQGRQCCQGWWW